MAKKRNIHHAHKRTSVDKLQDESVEMSLIAAGSPRAPKEKGPLKSGRWSPHEILYLKQHWQSMGDAQIGEFLNRAAETISEKRRSLKLKKKTGRPSHAVQQQISENLSSTELTREAYQKLTKVERREYFKTRFQNTEKFRTLQDTLSPLEIDMYVESYLDYLFEFETLQKHEEDTLHMAIVELIRQKRFLSTQQAIREAVDNNEESRALLATLDPIDRQYKESVSTYSDLMKSLNATRAQRLSQTKESKRNLASVVAELQDEEVRERLGREAAIIEAATKVARASMIKEGLLLT